MKNEGYHDGDWVDMSLPQVKSTNRMFRYGDGVFESIRVVQGKPFAPENHFQRMMDGAEVLGFNCPQDFSLEKFVNLLNELIQRNSITKGARIRLALSRQEGGFYLPENDGCELLMEIIPLEQNEFYLNDEGLKIGQYSKVKKVITPYSGYKTANGLLYIMAAKFAAQNEWDDVLIFNNRGGIIESYKSNLFIVSNGVLYTPGLEEGCLGGTMRMNIINIALENGIKVYECNLLPQNLLAADELFLTNAIQGLQWVVSYKSKRYYNDMSKRLVKLLNEKAT